jgi:hypothetical protein
MQTETNIKEIEMSYKVYHTKNWALNTLLHFNIENFNPHMADYKIVADVHVDSIGPVFQFTNHIDHAWQENVEVTAYDKKARSTSVGDVVEDPNGQLWICASVGWEKVEWNNNLKSDDAWWKENGERYATYAAELAMA